MKDSEDSDPLEDACEDDSDPRLELEDMDKVEAERTLSWDSSWVMARMASVSCWSSICLVSWTLRRSAIHRLEVSKAALRSYSNLSH